MKAQITFTVAAGKRLIARAVSVMPQLIQARKNGKVLLAGGTTVSAVSEELGYGPLWISGRIVPSGTRTAKLSTHPTIPHTLIINQGHAENADEQIETVMAALGSNDLIIIGANVLLSSPETASSPYSFPGAAALALAVKNGGVRGIALRLAGERGVPTIIACGLEKYVPGNFEAASAAANREEIFLAMGAAIEFLPLLGQIVTELEALRFLFNVEATAIAGGGILGGEGSRVFAISGPAENLQRAVDYAHMLADTVTSGANSSLITCEPPLVNCGRHKGCLYLKKASS